MAENYLLAFFVTFLSGLLLPQTQQLKNLAFHIRLRIWFLIPYNSNYFQVVINVSQVPIELFISCARMEGDCSIDPFLFKIGKGFSEHVSFLFMFTCVH